MTHLPVYFQAQEEIHQRLDWQQPQHQQQTTACHTSVSGVSKEKQSPSTTQDKSCERQSKVCDKGPYPFTQSEHQFCSSWPKKGRTVCAKASCHSIRNFWRHVFFRNLKFFFKVAGEVFASSIVQGGPAPGFLCPLVSLFRPFKEAANIRWTMISAQILHKNKTKWRVAPKRKTDTAAKHSLKQTADCTAPRSQIDWTIKPLNQKSQIAQEYSLLPGIAKFKLQKCGKQSQVSPCCALSTIIWLTFFSHQIWLLTLRRSTLLKVQKQINPGNGDANGEVNVNLKLTALKPVHASWLVDLYNHLSSDIGRCHIAKGESTCTICKDASDWLQGV